MAKKNNKQNEDSGIKPVLRQDSNVTVNEPNRGLRKNKATKGFFQRLVEKISQGLIRLFKKPYRFFNKLFLITGIISWVFIITFCLFLISFFRSIPDFQNPSYADLIQSGKQYVYKKLDDKTINHEWIPLKDVNRELLYTIVMAEDGNFFEHKGVNYDMMINALGENIKQKKLVFGASTISQQVVKNLYMGDSKRFIRKLKEIVAVRRMEKYFNKNEILELYLNTAEFGPDIFGVLAASEYYFHKHPADINAAEAAFLALMLPSPRRYHFTIFQNQYISPQHEKKRRRILRDMVYKEYISPKQYEEYLNYQYFN